MFSLRTLLKPLYRQPFGIKYAVNCIECVLFAVLWPTLDLCVEPNSLAKFQHPEASRIVYKVDDLQVILEILQISSMEKLRNKVISLIRACIISFKGDMTLNQLNDEYAVLVGETIPFTQLGFKSLEDFLKSEPYFIIKTVNNEKFIEAKISEKSSHIVEMVEKQKNPRNSHAVNGLISDDGIEQCSLMTKNKRAITKKIPVDPDNNENEQCSDLAKRAITKTINLEVDTNNNNLPVSSNGNGNGKLQLPGKRRVITKKINFNLHNNIPVLPKKIKFFPTGDDIQDLKNFVEIYKLGEFACSYKLVKSRDGSNDFFSCIIKVGNLIYVSWQGRFNHPKDAERHCAKKALKELMHRKYILERIPLLLKEYDTWILHWQLEVDYSNIYKFKLPTDWLQCVENNACIEVKKCKNCYMLRYCGTSSKRH